MPCDDGSQEHVDDYEAAVGVLQCVLDRHLGSFFFVFGGDFNAEKSGTNINMCIFSARKTICCG